MGPEAASGHGEADEIRKEVLERGYAVIRGALDEGCVEGFVRQIEEYMREATMPELQAAHKKRDAEGQPTQIRAHDASFGRGQLVTLTDNKTWPKGGARRVLECVPLGQGEHWAQLQGCERLRGVLDKLLGEGGWEMPVNVAPKDEQGTFIRHWYAPVVFPEHVYGVHQHPPCAAAHRKGPEQEEGREVRPALLCSWKEEVALNGPMERSAAGMRWQPVNRRRYNSKGWHIDIGPGFEMQDVRTLKGDPRQGVVLLLLLSNWEPGCGGTAFVPFSHEWVRERLTEAAATEESGGLTHDALNMWCQDRMKALTREGRILIPVGGGAPSVPEGSFLIDQVVGSRGDIVVCHPWVIHSGTTNMGDEARLMCNGMVKINEEAFARAGGMPL